MHRTNSLPMAASFGEINIYLSDGISVPSGLYTGTIFSMAIKCYGGWETGVGLLAILTRSRRILLFNPEFC